MISKFVYLACESHRDVYYQQSALWKFQRTLGKTLYVNPLFPVYGLVIGIYIAVYYEDNNQIIQIIKNNFFLTDLPQSNFFCKLFVPPHPQIKFCYHTVFVI